MEFMHLAIRTVIVWSSHFLLITTLGCTTFGAPSTSAPNSDSAEPNAGSVTIGEMEGSVAVDQPVIGSGFAEAGEGSTIYVLGSACTADSDCGPDAWCPTDTVARFCSPLVSLDDGAVMRFVFVPAGTFRMGSPRSEAGHEDNEQQHSVTLSRSFFVARTEVTQGQWKLLSGGVNPSYFQNTTCLDDACAPNENMNDTGPVESVDWYSVVAYANALSLREGLSGCYTLLGCDDEANGWKDGLHEGCTGATFIGLQCTGYRLPTESEWEYAARAGTTTSTYAGDLTRLGGGDLTLPPIAWAQLSGGDRTQIGGMRRPNAWGLHDMLGNVMEWTHDGYDLYPAAAIDPLGASNEELGVLRGGAYFVAPQIARAAFRFFFGRRFGFKYFGFRLVRTVPLTQPDAVTTSPSLQLGDACTSYSICGADSWCPTDTAMRVCSPRLATEGGAVLEFQFIPSGAFIMGMSAGQEGDLVNEVPHSVIISRNFFVGRTEVTQGQWKSLSGGINPSYFQNTTCISAECSGSENANDSGPVEQVDWYSAVGYANALSTANGMPSCYELIGCTDPIHGWEDGEHSGCTDARFEGLDCPGYRLLTESEWEYAARAGTTTSTYAGDLTGVDCDDRTLLPIAWFCGNAGDRTNPVGGKLPNAWGLYDMLGNVYELINDWQDRYPGAVIDPLGSQTGSNRGGRGGSWGGDAWFVRSAARNGAVPSGRGSNVGFRLARTAN
jgi:sulfatase modifying factor 1